MLRLTLMLVAAAAPPDTVVLSVAAAYEQAMVQAPELQVADLQAQAASQQARQAGAFPNPALSITAENLGRTREITGLDSPDGIEGQAVLSIPLPLGPTRSGVTAQARGREAAAAAGLEVARGDAAVAILGGLGAVVRQQALVQHAREELETLTRLTDALALQAREGRASRGDAARAELARGMAATSLARRDVVLASASTDLARRLNADPDQVLTLELGSCSSSSPALWQPDDPVRSAISSLPDLERARADLQTARGSADEARGLGLPDFIPQIGLRRGQGFSALYLGLSTTLPFFDRGGARVAAARLQADAASASLDAVELRLAAELAAARRGLTALEEAGQVFTASWFQALEDAVSAAEARYDLGEGTLFELLDQRRARLQALDDYAVWQSEWWNARARVVRLQGSTPDASLICTDPFREN